MTAPTPGRVLEPPESAEAPVYRKFRQEGTGQSSNFWGIACDEGWKSSVLCADMYERDADWLLSLLGRRPRGKAPQDDAAQLCGQLQAIRALAEQHATPRGSDIMSPRAVLARAILDQLDTP